jgi:Zn-dependent metalloprotease
MPKDSPKKTVVFDGAKIDGRRVQLQREPESGRISELNGFLSGPLQGAPEEAASQFLDANRRLLKSSRSTIRELQVEKVTSSPAGYHVVFQQTRQGVPVEEAKVSVHMTPDKRVHAAQVGLEPGVSDLNVDGMAVDGIDADEAVRIALSAVQGSADSRPQAEQVLLADDEPYLAWKVSFSSSQPVGDHVIWVDARNGRVVKRHDVAFD